MVVIVCKANEEHTLIIKELARKTYIETYGPTNPRELLDRYMNASYTTEALQKDLKDPLVKIFVAFDDDNGVERPVGFCQLNTGRPIYESVGGDPKENIELQRIYVEKSAAGKGVGSKLMERCLLEAKNMNKKTIYLLVWELNSIAIQFYEKYGFFKVGSRPLDLIEREDQNNVMIKSIV